MKCIHLAYPDSQILIQIIIKVNINKLEFDMVFHYSYFQLNIIQSSDFGILYSVHFYVWLCIRKIEEFFSSHSCVACLFSIFTSRHKQIETQNKRLRSSNQQHGNSNNKTGIQFVEFKPRPLKTITKLQFLIQNYVHIYTYTRFFFSFR